MLLSLRHYNIRQYEMSKLENSRYTLSEKFQISENIRSLVILWRSAMVAVVCIFIIIAVNNPCPRICLPHFLALYSDLFP